MKSRMWHVTMIEPQLSKDWNNYWRLIHSLSIGEIYGIFWMILLKPYKYGAARRAHAMARGLRDPTTSSRKASTAWAQMAPSTGATTGQLERTVNFIVHAYMHRTACPESTCV